MKETGRIMMIQAISILLVVMAVAFAGALVMDAYKHREEMKNDGISIPVIFLSQIATWFLGTFGVSDTAMNLMFFRLLKVDETRKIPGTIVAGAAIPLCIMSVGYLGVAAVDPLTLIVMIAVTSIGGFTGSLLVSRLNIQVVRLIMGTVLLATAVFLVLKMIFGQGEGGTEIGLTAGKLVIAAVLMFVMECLVMLGFGNTVPSMSMLLTFGIHPLTVFPIVMSSVSFGSIMGCFGFIKNGTYNRKVAITEAIGGSIGVLIAVRFVAGMDVKILQILMILIMIYNSYMMFKDYADVKKGKEVR